MNNLETVCRLLIGAMELWQRLLVIGIVLAATILAARLIDRRILGVDSALALDPDRPWWDVP